MSEGQRNGIVGATAKLGQTLITTLPPAFLLLVLMNIGFLAIVMWFLNSQLDTRLALLNRILDACIGASAK